MAANLNITPPGGCSAGRFAGVLAKFEAHCLHCPRGQTSKQYPAAALLQEALPILDDARLVVLSSKKTRQDRGHAGTGSAQTGARAPGLAPRPIWTVNGRSYGPQDP